MAQRLQGEYRADRVGRAAEARAARIKRYSSFVRVARIVLPVCAMAAIALVFFTGRERGGIEDLLSAEEIARLGAGLRLDNPRFQGATDGGEPFTLSAITATPDGPLAAEIALDAPEGTLTMGDGRLVEGRADEGMMLRDENELTLTGAVTITTSDGYRFETQTLTLDIADGGATAPSAIEGTGPQGSIVADRMTIETVPEGGEETEFRRQGLSGARFRFEGSVRVLFTPEVKD